VTIGADLLYRREVEDDLLHGIMAITPYSLLPQADDWVARPCCLANRAHFDPIFPSSYSSGTYNAMLSLLPFEMHCENVCDTACDNTPCNGASLHPAPYTEFGWSKIGGTNPPYRCLLSPVLWLTGQRPPRNEYFR
jgi:hypothetical protein